MNLLKSQVLGVLALCAAAAFPGAVAAPAPGAQASRSTASVDFTEQALNCEVNSGQDCIAIGRDKQSENAVAWTFGATRCDTVTLTPLDENFCDGKYFVLDGMRDGPANNFTIMGCGGKLWANTPGGFFLNCVEPSGSIPTPSADCGTLEYLCAKPVDQFES
ncbi:hypothetical protein B0H15DRAFT_801119 [Mycena belliarum]|uniref:Uncharacterized protein n=1 Tax=Mycena belliarum TaxID=1033014 RepID=A0AAD6U511_9AGAR|nr:hypothetical protein B0H15DRAFT_801119 [Mycena belliae]